MESEHLQKLDVSWGHEPAGIPLNRPPGTFSPTGGEGRDEGVRFMESLDAIFVAHGAMNPGTHVGQASSLPVRAASLPPKCSAGRMPAEPAAKMAALRPHGSADLQAISICLIRRAPRRFLVAQICNLPYRRIVFCGGLERVSAWVTPNGRPMA